jgi:hypothetical protein
VLGWALVVAAHGSQPTLLWDHGSHTRPSPEERALRDLLDRYSRGDIDGAVRGVEAGARRWVRAAVDDVAVRLEEEIAYHRRPQNRLGAAHDDRLEAWLRADRVNILRLAAALQLDASLALTAVDPVGWHVLDAERAIDLLHALREDFARSGPVPWPIAVNEPWDGVDGREAPRSADWPAVSAFVRGWYSAAAARLQALVELRLLPALIARGLGLFPDDPDLLLARGSFVETRLALARVDASLAAIVYPSDVRQRWRGELAEAERDYERAANAAGATREAAVRLARVRLLKEDAARARELLGGVLAAETSGELRYLALLLRAAAAEQAGDRESAARDYEAAAAAFPGGQTALLALARVADERNLPADAFRTNNPMRWAKRYLAQLQQAA